MSQSNYIKIEQYMLTDLKLSGYNLLVYAIVENFTKNFGEYRGGAKYIETTYQIRHATVIDSLKTLSKMHLIEKSKDGKIVVYKSTETVLNQEYGNRTPKVRKSYSESTETVLTKYGNRTKNTIKNTNRNTTGSLRARERAEDEPLNIEDFDF